MKVEMTMDDFQQDKANCATCERQDASCPRAKWRKDHHNGYIKNSQTGDVGGIIYCCPHYTGIYKLKEERL